MPLWRTYRSDMPACRCPGKLNHTNKPFNPPMATTKPIGGGGGCKWRSMTDQKGRRAQLRTPPSEILWLQNYQSWYQ